MYICYIRPPWQKDICDSQIWPVLMKVKDMVTGAELRASSIYSYDDVTTAKPMKEEPDHTNTHRRQETEDQEHVEVILKFNILQ